MPARLPTRASPAFTRIIWAGTALLVVIAVAMVTRRALSLSGVLATRTTMSSAATSMPGSRRIRC